MSILFPSYLVFFHFRVCTGFAYGAYIKCSTKFLSGIALIHVSGDFFFSRKCGQCIVPSGFARFRLKLSCVALLLATTNFAVMFAPVPRRDPTHLSDRYSDFQQRFCPFSDSD